MNTPSGSDDSSEEEHLALTEFEKTDLSNPRHKGEFFHFLGETFVFDAEGRLWHRHGVIYPIDYTRIEPVLWEPEVAVA